MRSTFIALVLVITVTVVAYWRWFFDLSVLTDGDWGFFFNETQRNFFTRPFLWDYWGLGSINIGLSMYPVNFMWGVLSFITNYAISERILYLWPSALVASISSFLLVKKITNSNTGAIIGSFVYSFNTYFEIVRTGHLTITAAFAFAPLVLLLFINLLEKKQISKFIWVSIFAFFVSFYEFRIFYLLALLILGYTVFYSFIEHKFKLKEVIVNIILGFSVIFVVFLLNFYWLFGLSQSSSFVVNGVLSRNLFGTDFMNASRAMTLFHPFWTGTQYFSFIVQPIPIHFWLIPIFAFLGTLVNLKNKKILFFTVIAIVGILLTKQIAPPFPTLYIWLYEHFPGFNAFRESSKFYFFIALGYSVMIGGFVAWMWNTWNKRITLRIAKYFVTAVIALIFLWNAKPLITGDIGTLFVPREVPTEYTQLKDYLYGDKQFYRTLTVPYTSRFIFYNNTHPSLGYLSLPDGLRSLNPKLLSLLNIKYVILPYDSMYDIYRWFGPKETFKNHIETSSQEKSYQELSVKNIPGLSNIEIWQNPNNDIPQIYSVKDIVYVSGSTQLKNIIDFPTSSQVSYYFVSSGTDVVDAKETERRRHADEILFNAATKLYAVANCIRCDLEKDYSDYVQFPFARFFPNSPLYFIIEQKEEKRLKSLSGEPLLLELLLFSEKRAVEASTMILNETEGIYISKSLRKENELLNQIENEIKLMQPSLGTNNAFLTTYDYLFLQRKTLVDVHDEEMDGENQRQLNNVIYKIDQLINLVASKVRITRNNEKKLTIEIPETGEYKVQVKNDKAIDLVASKLNVDNKDLSLNSIDQYGYYDNLTLQKGIYPVNFSVITKNLLTLSSQNIILATDGVYSKNVSLPIDFLTNDKFLYRLSFEYKIEEGGEVPMLTIDTPFTQKDPYTNLPKHVYETEIEYHGDGKWHKFDDFFDNSYGAPTATLNFWLPNDRRWNIYPSKVAIRNLSLVKVINPEITFIKEKKEITEIPEIIYQRINQSHYKVTVKNAKEPFLLTFSELYHPGWELYENQEILDSVANGITTTYYDGNVKEMEYLSQQDTSSVFKMFTAKPVFDQNHVQTNSFANAWMIDKKGNYTLDIMFEPEKYVFIGFIISGSIFVILFGTGIYFFYNYLKKLKFKNRK